MIYSRTQTDTPCLTCLFVFLRITRSVSLEYDQRESNECTYSQKQHKFSMNNISNCRVPSVGVQSDESIYVSADFYVANILEPVQSINYNHLRLNENTSTKSDCKKRIIVRAVTIFAVILFLICFGMIALTLRMSEIIDEKSMETFFFKYLRNKQYFSVQKYKQGQTLSGSSAVLVLVLSVLFVLSVLIWILIIQNSKMN